MADRTSNIDALPDGATGQETRVNELLDAASLGTFFGRRASTTPAGLVWGYYGGEMLINGVPTTVANGTVTLNNNATNYVQLTQAGTVVVATTRDPRYAPLYQCVASAGVVTDYLDERSTEAFQRLAYGIATQAMADANQTISQDKALCETLVTTGALTATRNLVVPLVRRRWVVRNTCTGGSIQVIGATGTGTTIATVKTAIVECDGTNVLRITADA